MGLELGIAFAVGALLFWGVGDFLIQKTTRKVGDWETLFIITAFGAVILLPFVYGDIGKLVSGQDQTFFMLLGMSIVLLIAAVLDLEALRKGKIAIVEPILALEVPIAAIVAFIIINEAINLLQVALISSLLLGIVLISLKSHHFSRKAWLERGAILAVVGSVFLGLSGFLVGFASRVTSPLFANWFLDVFIATISLFYLTSHKRTHKLVKDFNNNKSLVLSMSVLDNFAWIAFAIAATLIPIAVDVAISEGYIALGALLGFLINKELLMKHQKAGLVISIASAIVLSLITV